MIRLISLPQNSEALCVSKLFRNQMYLHHRLPQKPTEIINIKVEEMIRDVAKSDKSNWDESLVDLEVA